jgi:lysophospholipase L1-like esterase
MLTTKNRIKLLIASMLFFVGCKHSEGVDDLQHSLSIAQVTSLLSKQGSFSVNYGKSIGIFGGSLSVIQPSQSAKAIWKKYLNVRITDYGIGGYGFSSKQGSIQTQVDHATAKDIYILWASTNDYNGGRECGAITDYTIYDGYDQTKLETQCGGINYCISKLKQINPKATIYFFISLPFFNNESGYNPKSSNTNGTGHNFAYYVEQQIGCCQLQNIKYFNQFELGIFNANNCAQYYSDNLHLNDAGYSLLGYYQALFLSQLNY